MVVGFVVVFFFQYLTIMRNSEFMLSDIDKAHSYMCGSPELYTLGILIECNIPQVCGGCLQCSHFAAIL